MPTWTLTSFPLHYAGICCDGNEPDRPLGSTLSGRRADEARRRWWGRVSDQGRRLAVARNAWRAAIESLPTPRAPQSGKSPSNPGPPATGLQDVFPGHLSRDRFHASRMPMDAIGRAGASSNNRPSLDVAPAYGQGQAPAENGEQD